ncbi:MAG: class I SAM-dependent methyltransferase [Betaproteobacteria bacterium]|nr:class I SAM-dependent methyltransferase [Betaproteobacteria bacterium]
MSGGFFEWTTDAIPSTISVMKTNTSIAFFDRQFQQQASDQDFRLNPFELTALPYLTGRVLDFGCGLGNLAMAAAAQGCSVLALDASPSAIGHLRQRAAAARLPLEAIEADLRDYAIVGDFDCVVSIGLLMFFDCPTALRMLTMLQDSVRPGGIAVINTLIEGTTWLDMFGTANCCLLARNELAARFAAWDVLHSEFRDFDALGPTRPTIKSFATLIARKPPAP